MAYTNLPPNLYDYFSTINQRIRKLESAPDQAMTTALQASTQATTASAQAVSAEAQATTAITQATTAIAQATLAIQNADNAAAQATSAQYVAGVAETSAGGKNTTNYATYAPSSSSNNINGTTPIKGDLWFVVDGSGNVNYQYGYSGSAWTIAPITDTVIANLNAGKITAGTITGIAYNNGSGTFYVSPSGALTATSATITGNITATSGTFTGTVYASSGTFTGTVYASAGTFTGTVTATSGSFTGNLYSSSGTIGGFTLSSTGLSNPSSSIYINSSSATVYGSTVNAGSGGMTSLNTITAAGTLTASAGFSLASGTSGYGFMSQSAPGSDNTYYCGLSSWRWKAVYAVNGTIQTSDSRLKTNTQDSVLGLNFINSLRPVSYKWIEGGKEVVTDEEGNPVKNKDGSIQTISIPGKRTHYGFLAQEVKAAIDKSGVEDFAGWVLDNLNDPNSEQAVNYQQFIAPIVKAIQEIYAELQTIKGANNGTGTTTTN